MNFEEIEKELVGVVIANHKSVATIAIGHQTRENPRTLWSKIKGSDPTLTVIVVLYVAEYGLQTEETRKPTVEAIREFCYKNNVVVEWHMAQEVWHKPEITPVLVPVSKKTKKVNK